MSDFYHKQKGMTLLEVVISMLLIGIAIVGSIAMLQTSIRYNQSANNQSMALYIAQEVIGKMQSNIAGADNYVQTLNTDAIRTKSAESQGCIAIATTTCTEEQWAASDIIGLSKDLILMLPSPSMTIQAMPADIFPAHSYEVQISWQDNDLSNNGSAAGKSIEQTITIPFTL